MPKGLSKALIEFLLLFNNRENNIFFNNYLRVRDENEWAMRELVMKRSE